MLALLGIRFGIKKAARHAASAANQAKQSVHEMQVFVEKKAWPEAYEKVSKVADSVSEAADNISKVSITSIEIMYIAIDSVGLLLMILSAILCRWIISHTQSERRSSFPSVVFYLLYIFCIFLAIHFAYDMLISLDLITWQENYQLISIVALSLPLLEVLFSIFGKF